MDVLKEISQIVEKFLSEDQFLVDAQIKGSDNKPKVIILIESDSNLTIDACAKISRKVADEIEENDLIDSRYVLEVSSPGIDQPLLNTRQYKKNVGRTVNLKTIDGKEAEGELKKVEEEFIILDKRIKKKGRKVETEELKIPFENIAATKVLVSFNK
jgi:ribosome maturation factor RimP